MLKVLCLYSNWILIWYILYRFKIVNVAPFISSLIATVVYTILCSKMKMSDEVFYFLFILHIIIPLDLIYIKKEFKTNILVEIKMFIIYNIYLYIACQKKMSDIYLKDMPSKYERYPYMTVCELLKLKKYVKK